MKLSQREKRIQQTWTKSKDMIQNLLTPKWPASWENFIGFYIWCNPTSPILPWWFTVAVRISWKTLCWKGSKAAETLSRASYLVYYIIWRMNLSKLSRKCVWVLRTETTNCRVSFIVLSVVFPTNFKIVVSAILSLCRFDDYVLLFSGSTAMMLMFEASFSAEISCFLFLFSVSIFHPTNRSKIRKINRR